MTPARSSALLSLALASLVAAEPDNEKSDRSGPPHEHHFFERLDSDQSGGISLAEFQAHPRLAKADHEQVEKLFQRLDRNDDRILQPEELRPPRRGPKEGWHRRGPLNFEQFARQPRVKDLSEERKQKLFQRLDRNNDGQLSRDDFHGQKHDHEKPPRDLMKALDRDENGEISFSEFSQAPPHRKLEKEEIEDRFETLDKNDDGILTPDEFPEKPERFRGPKKEPDSGSSR